MTSRLYRGTLFHSRHSPKTHTFSYQVFMPFVDLAALPTLTDNIPLWSTRRWAPARFRRADFLGDPKQPLIDEVRRRIREDTGANHEGPIYLLANWRYFGIQINPIACYFCYDATGSRLQYLVLEVTNTPWDERHSYVLTAPDDDKPINTRFNKALHVSPFNPMNMVYHWQSTAPGEALAIKLSNLQDGERIFDAALSLRAEPFDRKNLVQTILRFPFMTIKVAAAIYWQALRLWLKGVPVHPHPN